MTRRPLLLVALLAPSACALNVESRPETRWVGPLTAADVTHCPPSRGVLVIRGDRVTFTPDEGTWTLTGSQSGTQITASETRLGQSTHRAFETKLEAQRQADTIAGTYTTPICTYRLDLHPFSPLAS